MAFGAIDESQVEWTNTTSSLVVSGDVVGESASLLSGLKVNFQATAAPTGAASFASGYNIGSLWFWPAQERYWVCKGDAEWTEVASFQDLADHEADTANPHSVTAAQVGAYTSGAVDALLADKSDDGHGHDASDITTGVLLPAHGGTGATDAATARTNLGAASASHTHSTNDISDDSTWAESDLTAALNAIATALGSKQALSTLLTNLAALSLAEGQIPVAGASAGTWTAEDMPVGIGLEYVTALHGGLTASGSLQTVGTSATLPAGDYLLRVANTKPSYTAVTYAAYKIGAGSDVYVVGGDEGNVSVEVTLGSSATIALRASTNASTAYFSMEILRVSP